MYNQNRYIIFVIPAAFILILIFIPIFKINPVNNWPTLFIPMIAVFLAIKTRKILLSLVAAMVTGNLLLILGNPDYGIISKHVVEIQNIPLIKQVAYLFDSVLISIRENIYVFKSAGNTRNIIFTAMIGAMVVLMKKSGGTKGFVDYFQKKNFVKSDRGVQLYTVLIGALIFIENNISSLLTGAIMRPVYEKRGIHKTKLAYILDSTAAPVCVLIPFNAWWINIAQHLMNSGVNWGFTEYFKAYSFNFYAILTILFNLTIILIMKDFFTMKKYIDENIPTHTSGLTDEFSDIKTLDGIKPRAVNFFVPILSLIVFVPLTMFLTSFFGKSKGYTSGSFSIVWAILISMAVTLIVYKTQKIMTIKQGLILIVKGFVNFLLIAIILMLSFAIGKLCQDLGIGKFLAQILGTSKTAGALIPAGIFAVSTIVAFSTGTSWGTWAIMIPVAVTVSTDTGANIFMATGAVLGGAIFGDHASPISDTTIISSAAAGCGIIDHVKTQLPYTLITAGMSFILYVVFGFLF